MKNNEIAYLLDIIKIQKQEYGIRLRNVHFELEEIKHISYALNKNMNTLDILMEERNETLK